MARSSIVIVYAWLAALSVAFGVVALRPRVPSTCTTVSTLPSHLKLESLEVGRVDVVEPDGKPRVIVSSASRFPGIIWDGKEYPHPGREKGGVLFFDDDGTEAGGMIYTNDPSRKNAGAVLTFDQYRQQETLSLQYDEEDGKRSVGLAVGDQPDRSLLPVILANNELAHARDDVERARLKAALDSSIAAIGDGARRLYAGKREDGSAGVWLYDPQGKPRLRLMVAPDGAPSLELLDAEGKVVARMPDGGAKRS